MTYQNGHLTRALVLLVSASLSAALGGFALASCGSSDDGMTSIGSNIPGDGGPGEASMVGQLDGAPGDTGLPTLPELTNVVAVEREDSVGIDFDPVDDATDYRVYPLPDPSDVTVNANGSVTIKNAIYRCAGLRQTMDLPNGLQNPIGVVPDAGQVYQNPNGQYAWGAEVPTNPTLGYVYVTPGTGLVPVYAVGVHPSTGEVGWRETRPKVYTTDMTVRQTLLGQGGRDDGIVFYVPSAASADTEPLYHSETADPVGGQDWTSYTEYYFTKGDLASHMGDTTPPTPAFQILTAAADGTKPLMTVLYKPGMNHNELAVGKERFNRAANQGPGPLWHLEWAGITKPTTLVVEALATGCPFQGFLSPSALLSPPHQPLQTLAQIQQASATGEVFINGQYDLPGTTFTYLTGNGSMGGNFAVTDAGTPELKTPDSSPVAVARSFIQVAPQPHDPTKWDWYEGFNLGSDFGTVTPGEDPANCTCQVAGTPFPCQSGGGGCGYWTSPTFDIGAYELDVGTTNTSVLSYGQFLGQYWDAFDDVAQDVTGFLRFTAPTKANMDADPNKFLYITWSVNTVSTDRRYPQLIVSDQPSPVQDSFANPNSNTLFIQTRNGPSMLLEVQAFHGLVNGKPWAVNNQAPIHSIIDYDSWAGNFNGIPSSATTATIPPADPPFEHAGVDRMTRYDAYISAGLLYLYMDLKPAGCMQIPGNGYALTGPVTVTFGDVLYHEGAPDEFICAQNKPYPFMHEHQCTETKRQWDDLGFKSGVGAPMWDTTKFPCTAF